MVAFLYQPSLFAEAEDPTAVDAKKATVGVIMVAERKLPLGSLMSGKNSDNKTFRQVWEADQVLPPQVIKR